MLWGAPDTISLGYFGSGFTQIFFYTTKWLSELSGTFVKFAENIF